ncbi:urea ABC transporter substrate-binding protein [Gibbsiella greigii]
MRWVFTMVIDNGDNMNHKEIDLAGIKNLPRRMVLVFGAIALWSYLVSVQAAEAPTAQVNTTGLAVTDNAVKVGIVYSSSGTMAISETGSIQATRLAIEQINEEGGVLGRKIEFIQEDGASDWPTFAEKTRKLLINDKVATIFGGWTSASRKAMLPILEQYNGLLYYPTYYEGLEQSKNVIYTGLSANQQVIPALNWTMQTKQAKTFYFMGSDYIWPRTTNKIARGYIEKNGGKIIGEDYYPLGHTQFNSVINKIKLRKPDVIFVTVIGGSNVAFYKQLKAAGIDMTREKPLVLTLSVTEDETRSIGGENIAGAYTSMQYFQSLTGTNNANFVASFKKRWGDDLVVGAVTQSAYLEPWFWKAAVEKAGSFDVDKVRDASLGLELNTAPQGYARIHNNHHLWANTLIGKARDDGQFDVIYETPKPIEPNPFPHD